MPPSYTVRLCIRRLISLHLLPINVWLDMQGVMFVIKCLKDPVNLILWPGSGVGRWFCKHTSVMCDSSGQSTPLALIVDKVDCVPESEHEVLIRPHGNEKLKTISKDKGAYEDLLKAELECIGYCISSRGDILHLVLQMLTTVATLNKS